MIGTYFYKLNLRMDVQFQLLCIIIPVFLIILINISIVRIVFLFLLRHRRTTGLFSAVHCTHWFIAMTTRLCMHRHRVIFGLNSGGMDPVLMHDEFKSVR